MMTHYPFFLARCSTEVKPTTPTPVGWVSTQQRSTKVEPTITPIKSSVGWGKVRTPTSLVFKSNHYWGSFFTPTYLTTIVGWKRSNSVVALSTHQPAHFESFVHGSTSSPRTENNISSPRTENSISKQHSKITNPFILSLSKDACKTSFRPVYIVKPTISSNIIQSGFTLLEMVLVLFLVGLMASATLMLTENVEDQAKYDETKRRMDIMRKAIVGDPTRSINGGPEISGFVADMGRLPLCVAELLELGDEKVPNTDPKTYTSPCDASQELIIWSRDTNTGLSFGWRGPYIQVLPERNGDLRFRDGYANADASDIPDAQNSGWSWELYDSSDASNAIAHIQSAGVKPLFTDGDEYPSGAIASVPPLIYQRDHLVTIDSFTARIVFLNDSSTAINSINEIGMSLRIHYPDGTATSTSLDSDPFSLFVDASNPIPAFGTRQSAQITFNSGELIPLGIRTVEVLCNTGDVFRGTSCNNVHETFVSLSLLPNTQSSEFNFIWDIQ